MLQNQSGGLSQSLDPLAALSVSSPPDFWGDKERVRVPPPRDSKPFRLSQSFASPLLTPLNYSLRGKDKQSLLATVVLLISLGNITDNKKRAGGENLGCCHLSCSLSLKNK